MRWRKNFRQNSPLVSLTIQGIARSVMLDLTSDLKHIINSIRLYSVNTRLLLLLDDLSNLQSGTLNEFLGVLSVLMDHENIDQGYKRLHQHIRIVMASSASLFSTTSSSGAKISNHSYGTPSIQA